MTSTEHETSIFFAAQAEGFGTAVAADEKLHREYIGLNDSPELTETQFFGFSVPEAGINALTYLWAHPNLGITTSAAWVWQGGNAGALESEIFDARHYLPLDSIMANGDIDSFTLPNDYSVEVITPLEKVRLRYDDPARDNSFDVTATAVMPPAMLASGTHFDQAMRMEGHLRLRGKDYRVDGHHVRDRSWGESRPEAPRDSPPFYWSVPVFGDDFAMNITGIDDPTRSPAWSGLFDIAPEQAAAYNRGWVWRDGELYGLAQASIRTDWDRATSYPTRQVIELTDTGGRDFVVTGTVEAPSNWTVWSNLRANIMLARWECKGRTGWGDLQAMAWTDFARHLRG